MSESAVLPSFSELGLSEAVVAALKDVGYETPTPIQAQTIPALLGGAEDELLSYRIAHYTNVEINWGMACALGALLLAATLVLYAVYRKVVKSELSMG